MKSRLLTLAGPITALLALLSAILGGLDPAASMVLSALGLLSGSIVALLVSRRRKRSD